MNLCNKDCYPICDFCKYYNFNPGSKGEYVNNGYCQFHKRKQNPLEECEQFECKLYKE